jgi:CRISPR-associated endoribonuclease Cas6
MDLLSLVLTLRPKTEGTPPPRLGRAAYAILLDRLSPALAAELHDEDGPKPFTCSTLMGPRAESHVSPEQTYTLRYTALTAPVAAGLLSAFTLGDTLTFEGVDFTIEASDPQSVNPPSVNPQSPNPPSVNLPSPWAGSDDYQALAARHLLPSGAEPRSAWTFLLAAPTSFQSQGVTQSLPLPGLFFGSLLQRWNAFAPVALPADEVRRYAETMVGVSRFALHSAPGWDRGRGVRIGAIGRITYRALNRDRYWLAVLSVLAAFACYSGVGAMTTMGMGQARELED